MRHGVHLHLELRRRQQRDRARRHARLPDGGRLHGDADGDRRRRRTSCTTTQPMSVRPAATPTAGDFTFSPTIRVPGHERHASTRRVDRRRRATIVSYQWDFGDGTTRTRSRRRQQGLRVAGTYTVTLTVTRQPRPDGDDHDATVTGRTEYGSWRTSADRRIAAPGPERPGVDCLRAARRGIPPRRRLRARPCASAVPASRSIPTICPPRHARSRPARTAAVRRGVDRARVRASEPHPTTCGDPRARRDSPASRRFDAAPRQLSTAHAAGRRHGAALHAAPDCTRAVERRSIALDRPMPSSWSRTIRRSASWLAARGDPRATARAR